MLEPKIIEGFQNRFSDAVPVGGTNFRFIPRTIRRAHHRESAPFEGWVPCLFRAPPTVTQDLWRFENPLADFRETVAIDLANGLIKANLAHHLAWNSMDPEFCDSLGADDGDRFWCQCTPCRSTNGTDGNGSIVYKGFTILQNLVRFEEIDPELWLSQDPSRVQAQRQVARRTLYATAAALSSAAAGSPPRLLATFLGFDRIPVESAGADLERFLDGMALWGIIPDRARLNTHTRRLLVLMNRAALALAATARPNGSPMTVHPEHTLLTFLTYLDYTAPPIFAADPVAQAREFYPAVRAEQFFSAQGSPENLTRTVLHPFLTPMISASRDLFEYDDQLFHSARHMAPFMQHRNAPEQFNHRRWSLIANQTGLYEWKYGRTTLAPRIYTRRLRNALQGAYEQYNARVFLAEAEPHMGLDGIKFHELAQVLWDVRSSVHEIREDYCRALFGPDEAVVQAMFQYFNELETAWANRERNQVSIPGDISPEVAPSARVVRPREHRYSSAFNYGTHLGYGIMGRSGWLTELEPFMWRSAGSDATPDQPGGDHFSSIWGHIERAYQTSLGPNANPIVTQRVQYFRRAMGLVGVLIKVYRPILDVWRTIAHQVDPLAADPLDWAQIPAGNMMVPAWTIGGMAASRVPLAQRRLLGERLTTPSVSWVRANGFRSDVREPIHQYLAGNSLTIAGLGSELGLGLSPVSYVPGGRIGLDASASGAMKQACYLRYVRQYVEWWNRDDVRDPIRLESARADEGKAGIGVTWFLNTKRMIAAMMIIGSQPGADGTIRPFDATAVNSFLRDA